jgi:beta-lactamase class A
MASSPRDLVAFYTPALQGELFRYAETLAVFRAILALADAIPMVMPLGVNAFLKGGSLDLPPHYALSLAGGLYVPHRWVYFALIANLTDEEPGGLAKLQAAVPTAAQTIFRLVPDRLGT